MSGFDTAMAAAMDPIRSHFGQAITYTPAGGSPVAIADGLFAEDADQLVDESDGQVRVRTATAVVEAADVATPTLKDTVTVGAEVWSVMGYHAVGGGASWELRLTRTATAEKSRETYRIRRA